MAPPCVIIKETAERLEVITDDWPLYEKKKKI